MKQKTIQSLAETLKQSPEKLLAVIREIGLPYETVDKSLSPKHMIALTKHLTQKTKNNQVVRKDSSTIYSKSGAAVTVNVSKRYFQEVQSPLPSAPAKQEPAPSAPPVEEPQPKPQVASAQKLPDDIKNTPEQKTTKAAKKKPHVAAPTRTKAKEKKALTKRPTQEKESNSHHKLGVKKPAIKKLAEDFVATKNIKHLLDDALLEEAALEEKAQKRQKETARNKAQATIKNQHAFQKPKKPSQRKVEIGDHISLDALAKQLAVKNRVLTKKLAQMGASVDEDGKVDQETATLVVEELGHTAHLLAAQQSTQEALFGDQTVQGDIKPRAPVVAVMGHVDHGKTSLLDYIRKTQVVSGESGGITQHIGAYQVHNKKGKITFLDTPGHAAFTAMRSRGAEITDIVVLIIAADDGIMPQTVEAIQHARVAEVAIVVVITKIDKAKPDIEKIKGELSSHQVVPEDWGGETPILEVSSHTGEGIEALITRLLLQAEVMELRASVSQPARGHVMEARLDKHKGPVAHLLVTNGILKKGDLILAGDAIGKVRSMTDENNKLLEQATPSTPVEILGLSKVPEAGCLFTLVQDEKQAQKHIQEMQLKARENGQKKSAMSLEDMLATAAETQKAQLQFVVRADVRGTLEAILHALEKLNKHSDQVAIKIVSSAAGAITEADVMLAQASNSLLLGFHVRADSKAKKAIEKTGVEVRYYSVIYNLIEDIEALIAGAVEPEKQEKILGLAEVREVFSSPKFGQVAGCFVLEGSVMREKPVRILRDQKVIFSGELNSLKRFSADAKEVKHGTECGIGVHNYKDIKPGDQIEVYEQV